MKISLLPKLITSVAVALAAVGAPASPPVSDHDATIGLITAKETPRNLRVNQMPTTFTTVAPGQELKAAPQGKAAASAPLRTAPRKITSLDELNGNYVMTVKSLMSGSFGDDGNSCDIARIAGTDSVKISRFWNNAVTLKAHIDLTTGEVTIPNQVVGTVTDNGDMDIAACDKYGKPQRKELIKGQLNADGTITIESWWGFYVVAGPNKDRSTYYGYDTRIERSNAKMSFKMQNGDSYEFGVIVRQKYDNEINIINFGNYGMTVVVKPDTNRGGTIPSQVARQYPANGNFVTCAVGSYTPTGNPQDMTGTINLTPAAVNDNTTLQWGKWTAVSMGAQNMYFGAILDGKIELLSGTFVYPKEVTGELNGAGTQADPYKISTLKDLQILAKKVNEVPESDYNAEVHGVKCARVFAGKYFRLENDIDMGSTLFTPIGRDAYHLFAGNFDGNGHTLKNLSINVEAAGFGALFGYLDAESVLKNIRLDKPSVRCAGQTAATLAGWSMGLIENCHATDVEVFNTKRIAGGLVGVGATVKNCTVTRGTIHGQGGNAAGLAGQIDNLIEDCRVEGVTIIDGGGGGLPAGGVVASLNASTGRRLAFSGTVDTYSYLKPMSCGGVVGVMRDASLSESYATGNVRGGMSENGYYPAAGGVAGKVYGSSIDNCFFTGYVGTFYSRMAGGITGWLTTSNTAVPEKTNPVVKDCFTAATVVSETYLYNINTEVRESLGYIQDGCTPDISNVYFDNQITNLNSVKYQSNTAELTGAAGPKGFTASKWHYAEGQYPRLKWDTESQPALMAASAIVLPERNSLRKISADGKINALGNTKYEFMVKGELTTKGHYSTIEDGKLKISDQFGTDTLRVTNGDAYFITEIKIAPVPFTGEGTETNPYLITNKAELMALGEITTVGKQYFPDSHFRMTNDIDLEQDSTFMGICNDKDAYCKFAGIFDGNGHAIHNMKYRFVVWTVRPEANPATGGTPNSSACEGVKGFIGKLHPQGVLKNLTIASDCDIQYWARSGALVGQNEGLIENCRNYADVWAASACPGGIVGENRKGTIRRCYNAGTITSGYNGAGGITGTSSGIIEQCVNAGNVNISKQTSFQTSTGSMTKAGGITGENSGSNFIDCVNYGNVYCAGNTVGGIAGQLAAVTGTTVAGNNSVIRCINLGGVVSGTPANANIGAIGGTAGTTGTVENTYWDGQLQTLKAHGSLALKGAEGINTSVLTSGKALEGYDPEIWLFEAGKYPVIKAFANEELVSAARGLYLTLPANITAENMQKDGVLSSAAGTTWSLAKGTNFKIEGNKLLSPAEINEKLSDELTGKSGNYTRVIALSVSPRIPLKGEGTAEEPYLIGTAAEWNTFADYITGSGLTFKGLNFKISADIDFTGTTFKPWFLGNNNFEGTLDGADHTVKGIAYTTANTYEAAIGTLATGGVIRNLTLAGEITSAKTYTGGFAAKVYGRIENCENRVNVTTTASYTGGFGYLYGGAELIDVVNTATICSSAGTLGAIAHTTADGVTFTRVINKGVVKTTGTGTVTTIGGLVGNCSAAILSDCANEGTFEFSNPGTTNTVGGLLGYANATSSRATVMTLTRCYNKADITANNMLGGLISQTAATSSNTNPLIVKNCYNTGNITSVAVKSTSNAPTAGLLAFYNPGSVIDSCYNSGNITSPWNVYAAGIAAQSKVSATEALPAIVSNCRNYGTIVANGNQGSGIVALGCSYLTIRDCVNEGNVSGGFACAGILSNAASTNITLERCINLGDVITSTNRSGGIIGWGNSENTFTDLMNAGNVATTLEGKGTSTVTSGFAIGGIAGYSGAKFVRCYNVGSVKGASRVGGIVGQTFKGRTALEECYNAGAIIADPDTCGSLIGNSPLSSADWNDVNYIKNCYYTPQKTKLDIDMLGTQITEPELCKLSIGEGWTKGDDYSLPVPTALFAAQEAKLWSVCVVAAEGDVLPTVTGDFFIGHPEGISLTSSVANVSIDGTNARFSAEPFTGAFTITATDGVHTREFSLKADKQSGIEDLDVNDASSMELYNLQGVRVYNPQPGQIYIYRRGTATGKVLIK